MWHSLLCYLNPVGAYKGGRISEDQTGIPNYLLPDISQAGLAELLVFGDDYSTSDDTGVCDYIHVVELALGHWQTLEKLNNNSGVVI